MARITLRQLLDHAAEQGYGVPAFNINNMEQALAIMEAAEATDSPVIMQASRGARSYANDIVLKHLIDAMEEAKTLIWNGPFGVFEVEPFDKATVESAKHAAALAKSGKLVAVAGGGDTVAALNAAGVSADFTFVSTAGGAFLEWMEGKELPGVAALAR